MHLFQIFLPLTDRHKNRFPRAFYRDVERELVARFDGFTVYPQAPASGLWKDDESDVQSDELVVYEVMCDEAERAWWTALRKTLEKVFRQERILIRAQTVEVI